MRIIRRALLVVLLALSFLPKPSFAADMTIVAQGTGSVTFSGLKCSFPMAMTFESSGGNFELSENDGPGTPVGNGSAEAQASCLQTAEGIDLATNVVPKQGVCQSTPFGNVGFLQWDPFTFSGVGTAANPYKVQQVAKSCDGTTTLIDRMIFLKANVGQTFSYTHDILEGTTVLTHVTATLTRTQ